VSAAGFSGGCQCGAVRYALHETPSGPSICHCRMCQKAVGGPFFATFTVKKSSIEWTRGKPSVFKSSLKMERGFCRDCGTPLYNNNWIANDLIHPAIATLDNPRAVTPEYQAGTESRLAWSLDIASLHATSADDAFNGCEALLAEIEATNRQHSDHDSAGRPPEEGKGQ
jgi:hypothetical protein